MNSHRVIQLAMTVTAIILSGALAATAADYHVGPDGNYSSLQSALDDAIASGDALSYVKIQAGHLQNGTFTIDAALTSGYLFVSGGWNSSFDTPTGGAESSVLEANYGGRVLQISNSGSSYVQIANLTIRKGQTADEGAGILITTSGTANVYIDSCRITENRVVTPGSGGARGGGIRVDTSDGGQVTILNNEIFSNQLVLSGDSHLAAGAAISAGGEVSIVGNHIHDNSCVGDLGPSQYSQGCAINAFNPLNIKTNIVSGTVQSNMSGPANGLNLFVACYGELLTERNLWWGGTTTGQSYSYSVSMDLSGSCVMTQRSSVIVGAPDDGLKIRSFGASVAHISNLTVADNPGVGISMYRDSSSTGNATIHNSISYGNGDADTDLNDPNLVTGSNLFGSDPGFAYPALGVYSLGAGSMALDAGYNTPPGGVGTFDIVYQNRIQNGVVDLGAYEGVQLIFADDFEDGDIDEW
jgi:hypothetical protein